MKNIHSFDGAVVRICLQVQPQRRAKGKGNVLKKKKKSQEKHYTKKRSKADQVFLFTLKIGLIIRVVIFPSNKILDQKFLLLHLLTPNNQTFLSIVKPPWPRCSISWIRNKQTPQLPPTQLSDKHYSAEMGPPITLTSITCLASRKAPCSHCFLHNWKFLWPCEHRRLGT